MYLTINRLYYSNLESIEHVSYARVKDELGNEFTMEGRHLPEDPEIEEEFHFKVDIMSERQEELLENSSPYADPLQSVLKQF